MSIRGILGRRLEILERLAPKPSEAQREEITRRVAGMSVEDLEKWYRDTLGREALRGRPLPPPLTENSTEVEIEEHYRRMLAAGKGKSS